MSTLAWIGILAGSCLIVALLTALWVSKRNRDKVAYMMDSLEDGETNFRFRDNTAMNRELNRIRSIVRPRQGRHPGCKGGAGDHLFLLQRTDSFCRVLPNLHQGRTACL